MVEVEKININDLKPAQYNPRIMPPTEMEKLKNNIKHFGLVDPIITDLTDNNRIIGGHQRWEALKEINPEQELNMIRLGDIGLIIKETQIKIKDTNDQKALNLSLNKISGDWDYKKRDKLLDELNNDNYLIELTGFDELDELTIELTNEINEWDNIDDLELETEKYKNQQKKQDKKEQKEIICPNCNYKIQ